MSLTEKIHYPSISKRINKLDLIYLIILEGKRFFFSTAKIN